MDNRLLRHEKEIDALLAKMTLEEKAGQLNQASVSFVGTFDLSFPALIEKLTSGEIDGVEFNRLRSEFKEDLHEDDIRAGRVGSFGGIEGAEKVNRIQRIAVEESRLGIPLLIGMDVIHGYRTVFPIPLAQAASWDPALVRKAAEIAAEEASAAGINWFFSPMLDIARDARWGRVIEGYGEDPWLCGQMARAVVAGYQGEDPDKPVFAAACAKHFVAYGAAEAGRDYNTVDVSISGLYNTYLPPYRQAVDAGILSIMSAFHALNGVPCSVDHSLLTDILRGEMGFEGLVISDANAIPECVNHRCASNERDAARKTLSAGLDMDLGSGAFIQNIPDLVESGELPLSVLDLAVRRVLRVKFALGLFDNPYRGDAEHERSAMLTLSHLNAARDCARQSIVLLKNEGNLLPLRKKTKKLAIFGKLADSRADMLGAWSIVGRAEDCVSIREGLRAAVNADTELAYSTGLDPDGNVLPYDEFASLLAGAEAAIVVAGESMSRSGEAASVGDISLPKIYGQMLHIIKKMRVPAVLLLSNGRPMAFPEENELCTAVLETWQLGVQAGHAIADVLFGDANPSGRLPVTIPYAMGQLPIYYNHLPTGRPSDVKAKFTSRYLDIPFAPLYPFGYGLSYTTFEYGAPIPDKQALSFADTLEVSVQVKNTGNRQGETVVQVYSAALVSSYSRPVRELKAFARVSLEPGETRVARLRIAAKDLGYFDNSGAYRMEPGEYMVYAGEDCVSALENGITITVR